jgi:hypothetical protein
MKSLEEAPLQLRTGGREAAELLLDGIFVFEGLKVLGGGRVEEFDGLNAKAQSLGRRDGVSVGGGFQVKGRSEETNFSDR